MENAAVILAGCPRGEAGQVNVAVPQSFLTVYTSGLLPFTAGFSGIGVLAIWAVRSGPGPLHLGTDSDPQAVVGCRVTGISLAGADVNPETHAMDHVFLLKP